MQNILIFGAGRSASSLISYLIEQAPKHGWHITVADMSLDLAVSKIGNADCATAIQFLATDAALRESLISRAVAVVSMLPASLHLLIAQDCLRLGKSLFNASYVSKELIAMDAEVRQKGLTFLCELGLDPGIDHMSAMQIIHELEAQNAQIESFRSYTGGLVAPESDNNPWHYKFSWNPRNVVVAGQSTAKYLQNNLYKYVPYQRLFAEAETVEIQGMGEYEIYPNRDSLSYREAYGLENIPTLLRATIRHKGFSRAWNVFVQLGLTDDSYTLSHSDQLTYRQYFEAFLPPLTLTACQNNIPATLAHLFHLSADDAVLEQLAWLEIYSDTRQVKLANATPAQVLQQLLEEKWLLLPNDKDMIIMQHEFVYSIDNQRFKRLSTLVQKGENAIDTAMSHLVGLPLAIAVKHYMLGNIRNIGVNIPTFADIYEPIMKDLAEQGVCFSEQISPLPTAV
jgi:saccharopine dehydrogenase-like NADP-dependent oxidoreductase